MSGFAPFTNSGRKFYVFLKSLSVGEKNTISSILYVIFTHDSFFAFEILGHFLFVFDIQLWYFNVDICNSSLFCVCVCFVLFLFYSFFCLFLLFLSHLCLFVGISVWNLSYSLNYLKFISLWFYLKCLTFITNIACLKTFLDLLDIPSVTITPHCLLYVRTLNAACWVLLLMKDLNSVQVLLLGFWFLYHGATHYTIWQYRQRVPEYKNNENNK